MFVLSGVSKTDQAKIRLERMPLLEKLKYLKERNKMLLYYTECYKAGLITNEEARRLRKPYLPKVGIA